MFNTFVSVTGAGGHVPRAVRRSWADGSGVCVHRHVPAAPFAPERLVSGQEDAANTSARGHYIFGREIDDPGSGPECLLLDCMVADCGVKSRLRACPHIATAVVELCNTVLCVHSVFRAHGSHRGDGQRGSA